MSDTDLSITDTVHPFPEHPQPINNHGLLEAACDSEQPVTDAELSDSEQVLRVNAIVVEDGIAWRVMIKDHLQFEKWPSIEFSRSRYNSDVKVCRRWDRFATRGAGGPQRLSAWKLMFEVFEAAVDKYESTSLGEEVSISTSSDS